MRVYIYFSVHEPLFARVAAELRSQHGLERASGFIWGEDQYRFLKSSGVEWGVLDVFTRWIKNLPPVSEERLAEIERRYDIPSFSLLVYTDRHLAKWDHERLRRLLAFTFERWEQMLDQEAPHLILLESIDGIVSYALYLAASKRGIPCLVFDTGRLPGRSALLFDAQQSYQDMDRLLAERKDQPLSAQARARAEQYIEYFRRDRKARQAGMVSLYRIPAFQTSEAKRLGHLVSRYAIDRHNPTLQSPFKAISHRFLRLFRNWVTRAWSLWEPSVPGERFILFPLHFQPEATTLVCATMFVDQIALLEDLAKCVPINYKIYVKEHFASVGRRPLSDYMRLKKLFNVRLLGPEEDSVALLEQAELLVTITGTMGWEAIMMEKPVVTFGDVFYNSYPQVYRAGQAAKCDWARIIRTALEDFQPNHELLLRFVDCVLDGTEEVDISTNHPWEVPSVLNPENVQGMARLAASVVARGAVPRN